MTASAPRHRAERAEARLRDLGFRAGRVSAAGHAGEIAALSLPHEEFERVLRAEGPLLARCLKELGFRYVALDLASPDDGGEG